MTRLLRAYDTSLKSGRLSEEMCKRYLDTLETFGHAHEALAASSLTTDLHPGSAELWQRRLSVVTEAGEGVGTRTRRSKVIRMAVGGGGGGRVGEVCREALDKVPNEVGVVLCAHD